MTDTREERIRAKAHELWEKEGRPEGQDDRHWKEAERIIAEASSIEAGEPSKDPRSEPRQP